MLQEKKILLCLCGGIAAYKCIEMASLLVKSGAIVKTIMTKSAMEFVTPLTFQTITKNRVVYNLFDSNGPIEHISLSDWADIIVIIPATANIIGKLANGIADDLLTTTVMASTCPKLVVPAMNVKMFENPIVQDNLRKLKQYDYKILPVETGRLACGYVGAGRLLAIKEVIYAIKTFLTYSRDLINKSILVTAGASIEKIDPMRYITNVSSGKMGLAIARAASFRGGNVTFVHSLIKEKVPFYLQNAQTFSANDMYVHLMQIFTNFDIIIMCAAVADYTINSPSEKKIKKAGTFTLELERTKDILEDMGKNKKEHQYLIGFAAESENLLQNAIEKLQKKKIDMIVANDLNTAGKDISEIVILKENSFDKDGLISHKGDKFYIAHKILDEYKNAKST